MSDLRKAAQAALEALELANVNHWWGSAAIDRAVVDLRAALAQDEPHPPHRDCGCADCAPSFEPTPSAQDEPQCKCDLRTKLVGDGCAVCNPLAQENRATTHSEECWRWHHQCAVAKIELGVL